MDGNNRKRLRPWLEAMLNSGQIEGLRWLDQEKMIFRIPWKHGGKHDWNPEDAAVFVEWAKHTGKYRAGVDEPDFATFKTRLRCAFNKASDINEIKDQTCLEDPNPYRVYRLTPKKEMLLKQLNIKEEPDVSSDLLDFPSATSPSQPASAFEPNIPAMVDDQVDSTASQKLAQMSIEDPEQRMPSDLNGLPSGDLMRGTEGIPTEAALDSQENMDIGTHSSDLSKLIEDLGDAPFANSPASVYNTPQQTPLAVYTSPVSESSQGFPEVTQSPGFSAPSSVASQQQVLDTDPLGSPHQQDILGQVIAETLQQPQQQQQQLQFGSVAASQENNEMHLTAFYSGETALHPTPVQKGCRLCYTPVDETGQLLDRAKSEMLTPEYSYAMYGDASRQPIYLPTVYPSPTKSQVVENTRTLLQNFTRGLLLDNKDGDIYATRFCKCTVYYCSPSSERLCQKLKRPDSSGEVVVESVRQKIFDFKEGFLPAFEAYKKQGGRKPETDAYLFVGQQGSPDELQQVLICIKVTSNKALQMVSSVPAMTSIQNSDSTDYDHLDKFVGDTTAAPFNP